MASTVWVGTYYGRDERPVVTFIDPRGGNLKLTHIAHEVVHSAMHAGIRERIPDFANAILQIVQLPYQPSAYDNGKKVRVIRVTELEGDVKYDFDQLDRMFTATLNLWDEIWAEAAEDTRKRADGAAGPLI